MIRSIQTGAEPIIATPWFSTPQPLSEGSFTQMFQDTVNDIVDSTAPPAPAAQPDNGAQNTQPQNSVQSGQDAEPKVQEVQENPQSAKPEDDVHTKAQPVSEQQTEKSAQDVSEEAPAAVLPDGTELDEDLLKELADLMSSKEDMLSAVEEMKQKLEELILQAFHELNDPEKQQKEYEEKILEFLLKYIEKVFGGEDDEEKPHALESSDEEDSDLTGIMDVLLQAVVQMQEDARSEDAQSQAPEENEEDIPEVGYVPPSRMMRETVSENRGMLFEEKEKNSDEKPELFELRQVKRWRAPRIHTEEHKPARPIDDPRIPRVGPAPIRTEKMAIGEEAMPEAMELTEGMENLYYQTAENIFTVLTQEQQPAQPVKTETSTETAATVSAISPADELEELTRLVKTGDSAKSGQPDLTDRGEKPEQSELKAELPKTVELESFGTMVVTAESEQVLTHPFTSEGTSAQQIVTQIVSEIFNQLPENGGNTTFVMTLNPESLGRVTVKLVEEAGRLSVTVTAHSKQTAELLAARLDHVQASMKENGTELEKYQVVYAPEKDERPGQQNYEGSSKNPYFRQDEEEGEGGDEFAELLQQAV